MAKKKEQQTRTKLEEINDSLSGIEQKFEQHKNLIYIIVAAILIIAFGFWAFYNFSYKKEKERAQMEIAKADELYKNSQQMLQGMAADSSVVAQATALQDSALKAYEAVAKEYGNNIVFKNGVGNLAKLNVAQIYYEKGKYADAQKYLEDYSPKGETVGPLSQVLLGDCYVNQDKFDNAVKAYDNAVDLAKESFWDCLTWREVVLLLLALASLAGIIYFAKKNGDPKVRRWALICFAIIFLGSACYFIYRVINQDRFENRAIIPYALQKKATVLDAQQKYDEEIKIYEEIEAKYYGPGSMSMQIERAKAKSGK